MDDVVHAVFSYVTVEEQPEEKQEQYNVVVPTAVPNVTGVRRQ